MGTLFSLDHKLYASDYDSDSDSVASENQPLRLWGVASYNPQTLFAAKGLLSGNSLDGTPKERGNGHTTLKM